MTIRHGLAIEARPLALPSPGRKTASGGLQPVPRHRLRRFPLQARDASGKNRPRYDGARRGAVLPQNQNANNGKLDTQDHTDELLKRLKKLRREIQNCPGAASSPQCAALWSEYMAIVNSPEMVAIRKDANDLQFQLWGYAFAIEGAGATAGPWGMIVGGAKAAWDYGKGKAEDWLGGF